MHCLGKPLGNKMKETNTHQDAIQGLDEQQTQQLGEVLEVLSSTKKWQSRISVTQSTEWRQKQHEVNFKSLEASYNYQNCHAHDKSQSTFSHGWEFPGKKIPKSWDLLDAVHEVASDWIKSYVTVTASGCSKAMYSTLPLFLPALKVSRSVPGSFPPYCCIIVGWHHSYIDPEESWHLIISMLSCHIHTISYHNLCFVPQVLFIRSMN
ncbi:hypothetical protein EDD16DRAFT_1522711 [Pisolithus croceorrhizus]|nr:hypothetical protein EDD16DRAFT_1522711 [Pisolithus croceorrhizus]